MLFTLSNKSSRKSLPKIKAPVRRARLAHEDGTMIERKPQTALKKITINLDGLFSTLMKDGNWCLDHESKAESRNFLHQTQVNEKLKKENETLKRRNAILLDVAKTTTGELHDMEKELRKLRHIVKKCAPNGSKRQ